MNPLTESTPCRNLEELAQVLLGESAKPTDTPEQLCEKLSRLLHVHFALRDGMLLMVAHPTPGQQAVRVKFPADTRKVSEQARDLLSRAGKQTPVLSLGYRPLRNGRPAVSIQANYAALYQLREQLNMALDHHDFDFETFSYARPDNGQLAGLRIDFIADQTLPEAPQPAQVPQPAKEKRAS